MAIGLDTFTVSTSRFIGASVMSRSVIVLPVSHDDDFVIVVI